MKYSGYLSIKDDGDYEYLSLSGYNEPLAKVLECYHNKVLSIHYFIVDKEMSEDEAMTEFLTNIDTDKYELKGKADIQYIPRYSEYTGYLWTDEDLMIGGHDLLEELSSNIGRYLILIVNEE
jgi:hypothetical protein